MSRRRAGRPALRIFRYPGKEYMKELVHRYIHPRALNVLRYMLKVRPYGWHWYGEWQEKQCAEDGDGRRQDMASFESDADHLFKRIKC